MAVLGPGFYWHKVHKSDLVIQGAFLQQWNFKNNLVQNFNTEQSNWMYSKTNKKQI